MAVSINLGTSAKSVGLTCGSANPAAQQRRPATRCVNVVVICYNEHTELSRLLKEADELTAIFVASRKRARE
jgi:hypothetical protein